MNRLEKLEKLLDVANSTPAYDAFHMEKVSAYINALRNAAPALLEIARAAKKVSDRDCDGGEGHWADLYEALKKLEEVEI